MGTRLELSKPDMVLPEFTRPDCSTPVLAKPELPTGPEESLKKPELLAPELKNPEALPSPLLKKPEEGTVVEFPKPGSPKIRPWLSPRQRKPLL